MNSFFVVSLILSFTLNVVCIVGGIYFLVKKYKERQQEKIKEVQMLNKYQKY